MKTFLKSLLVLLTVGFTLSVAQAEDLVFSDDFAGGFGSNWTRGTNTALNPGGPTVSVQDGRVTWTRGWDYIQTVQSFQGPFRVEVDLERTQGSVACKDFAVELVGTEGLSGVLRMQYGNITKDTINLGQAPAINSIAGGWMGVCVEDATGYKREMPTMTPHKGTVTLTYQDNKVKFAFKNFDGQTIETPWKQAGTMGAHQIRIWATSNFRFVDAVRVYSLVSQCPQCLGAPVTALHNQNFPSGTDCECRAATRIDIGPGTHVRENAKVIFIAPEVTVSPESRFHPGSTVTIRQ